MNLIERPQTLAEFIVNDVISSLFSMNEGPILDLLSTSENEKMAIELTTVIQRRLIEWSRDARRKIAEDKG